jgi:hypothetical protein
VPHPPRGDGNTAVAISHALVHSLGCCVKQAHRVASELNAPHGGGGAGCKEGSVHNSKREQKSDAMAKCTCVAKACRGFGQSEWMRGGVQGLWLPRALLA